jgi:hypothetical protein
LSLAVSLLGIGASGCQDIGPPVTEVTAVAKNECESARDCGGGLCDEVLKLCIAQSTEVSNLLIEIVPQSTEQLFGGYRFFRTIHGLSETQGSPLLLVPPPRVEGNVTLAINTAAGCKNNPRPVRISFIPLEGRLGLDTLSYSVTSVATFNDAKEEFEHTYSLSGLPIGTYDVYWEDAQVSDDPPPPLCEVVPRLERAVTIERVDGRVPQLDLNSSPIRPLKVLVPWGEDLEGWSVDVIHPLTGERLSTRARLSAERLVRDEGSDEPQAIAELLLGQVVGQDYAETVTQKGVLRLTPPPELERPTIHVGLEGLEVFSVGTVPVPRLKPFEATVRFQAWVWQEGNPDKPVTGAVTFDAVTLADVPAGVSARLTQRSSIGEDGQVTARLPPGTYTARVTPDAHLGLSAYNTSVEVFQPIVTEAGSQPATSGRTQAGQVISVPRGAAVSGHITLPTSSPPNGTSVEMTGLRNNGWDTPIGASAFSPRTVVALVEASKRFTLEATDCGTCDGENAVLFDLKVTPPPDSGFPWLVVPDVPISSSLDLGSLHVGLPQVYERTLQFSISASTPVPLAFPNALIRAYVFLDADNRLVVDPSVPACSELLKQPRAANDPPRTSQDCVQRALQVAEARSGEQGLFRLFLPRALGRRR